MSTEGSIGSVLPGRQVEVGVRRAVLRLGFGVTGSFVAAEALGWDLTFLGPMLAAQLLATSSRPPTVKQALGIFVIFAVALGLSLLVTTVFLSSLAGLVLAFALMLYLSFYGQLRGMPDIAAMLLQLGAVTVPVLAVASGSLASNFVVALLQAVTVALVTVWVAHAAFPEPDAAPVPSRAQERARADSGEASRFALRNTLILAPMLAWYLADATQVALVLLVTLLMVIRQYDPAMGQRAALGMIVGNAIGGLAASVAYNVIQLQPSIVVFAVVCLAASLAFAASIVRAGALAPVLVAGFSTFILLLGLGLSPLPGGSEEAFLSRLVNVLLATVYGVGALVLLGARPRPSVGRA